jgi:hypothetical protein
MGRALCVVLLALVAEPTLAAQSTSRLALHASYERSCPRSAKLPPPGEGASLKDHFQYIASIQAPFMMKMIDKYVPAEVINLLQDMVQPTVDVGPPEVEGAVALVQIPAEYCIIIGTLATMCTILSTMAVFQFFKYLSYMRPVPDSQATLSFEEFTDFAERIYVREEHSNSPHQKFSLAPAKFTDQEKAQYRSFISGSAAPEKLKTRFEQRREEEERAYSSFLKSEVVMASPPRNIGVRVFLPTALFMMIQLLSFVSAAQIGNAV